MKFTENWKICVLQICTQNGTKYLTKQSRKLEETEGNHLRIAKKIINHIPSFGVKVKFLEEKILIFNLFENERKAS